MPTPAIVSGQLPVPRRTITNLAMLAVRFMDASAKQFRFVFCLTARWTLMDAAGTLA
jgi:hypothetical protein